MSSPQLPLEIAMSFESVAEEYQSVLETFDSNRSS